MRIRGGCRFPTTQSGGIPTMQTLTARHSNCLMFSVCVLAERPVTPTNSSPVVPRTTSSTPHCPRHARSPLQGDHLAISGLYESLSWKANNLGETH